MIATLSKTERERSEAGKALTEQELNKYLDKLPQNDPAIKAAHEAGSPPKK